MLLILLQDVVDEHVAAGVVDVVVAPPLVEKETLNRLEKAQLSESDQD